MNVDAGVQPKRAPFVKFLKYLFNSLAKFVFTMVVGVFIANVFAHYGGYVDELFRGQIADAMGGLALKVASDPMITNEEGAVMIEELRATMTEQLGLNEPYWKRFFRYYLRSFTLDWGEDTSMREVMVRGGPFTAREALSRYLPWSMLLFVTSNLLTFFVSLSVAANLSKKPDGFMNKVVAALVPIFSAPGWIFGLFLIYVSYRFGFYSFMYTSMLPLSDLQVESDNLWQVIQGVSLALSLPVLSIFLSTFLQSIYIWRNFFLSNSREDYVEMAKAKGLSSARINRRYIIRPTLPAIITSFVLTLLGFWQISLAVEDLFFWQGIGRLFLTAIDLLDREMVMCIVVMFAYLLGSTIFILDIIYALVDPRIRLGGENNRRIKKATRAKGTWIGKIRLGQAVKSFFANLFQVLAGLPGGIRGYFLESSRKIKGFLSKLRKSSAAMIGLTIVFVLISLSIFIVIRLPFEDAERLWRTQSEDTLRIPKLAHPTWTNFFRDVKLPESKSYMTKDGSAQKSYVVTDKGFIDYTLTFEFEYPYADFPQDMSLFLTSDYEDKQPFVSLIWITPDNREIELANFAHSSTLAKRLSWELPGEKRYLTHNEITNDRIRLLLGDPEQAYEVPLPGIYQLQVKVLFFEEDVNIEGEFSVLGQVYGWAGSDHFRRDLIIPLAWGLPIALVFGITGTLFTNVFTLWIAAISAWLGGRIDNLLQRITEVNMTLPVLPGVIMFYYLYSKSIWVMLGVLIVLNIFSSDVKTYRAAFLQDKEAEYVQAALAYGASDFRIIAKYLIPRRLPILIPRLIISVPVFIFYEATLSFLGVTGFYIPTWGKIIWDAIHHEAAFSGHSYWILQPAVLFLIVGGAFTLLGLSLEKILNNGSTVSMK